MLVYLIRHGQTDSNTTHVLDTGYPGAPLNETGLAQAQALAATLGSVPIQAVFSSDLTRAIQTAEPLARDRGLEVTPLAGLREIYAGVDDMSPNFDAYVAMMRSWFDQPDGKLPGAESWTEVSARFESAMETIAETGASTAALVSHGALLRVWVPYAATNVSPGDAETWWFENTQYAIIEGRPGDWTLRQWGSHFPG